jgi:hypothetical protein
VSLQLPLPVVLDVSALVEYGRGEMRAVAVGELIREARADGAVVYVSALAVVQAYDRLLAAEGAMGRLFELLLSGGAETVALDLAAAKATVLVLQHGPPGVGMALAHSAVITGQVGGELATYESEPARRLLPEWMVNDLGDEGYQRFGLS